MLKLVSSLPDFYAHSGDAAVSRGEGFGCSCAKCGRNVTAPFGFERTVVWCLYCGIEEGRVPAVDSPWGLHKWTFGVTREEASEEHEWLAAGRFDEMAEERARRYGHVLDLF